MILNAFFRFWIFLIPISSIVLIPQIKGSVPSILLSFLSAILVIGFSTRYRYGYYTNLFSFLWICSIITLLSQLGILMFGVRFSNLTWVESYNYSAPFRHILFMQFLYLFAGYLTYLFTREFFHEKFESYLFYSALFIGLYGIYEVIYFSVFQQYGDFLSNRFFPDSRSDTGAMFQTLSINGVSYFRLKSLAGEPSMFAITMLPYWIYAIHKKKMLYQTIFLITLLLSTSTTAIFGICLYLLLRIFYLGLKDEYTIKTLIAIGICCGVFWDVVFNVFTSMVVEKVLSENVSGIERATGFMDHFYYFLNLPGINQLFGIGFGAIRSTDLFTTFLVNVGIVGFLIYSVLFLYPVYKLKSSYEDIGLKMILIVLYILMMIAVPEFAYLTPWLFLGIAYHTISNGN